MSVHYFNYGFWIEGEHDLEKEDFASLLSCDDADAKADINYVYVDGKTWIYIQTKTKKALKIDDDAFIHKYTDPKKRLSGMPKGKKNDFRSFYVERIKPGK